MIGQVRVATCQTDKLIMVLHCWLYLIPACVAAEVCNSEVTSQHCSEPVTDIVNKISQIVGVHIVVLPPPPPFVDDVGLG